MKKITSIRAKIFQSFIILSFLSIVGVNVIEYFILKNAVEKYNERELNYNIEMMMASLDYAVSHTNVSEENIASVLDKKILELSDVSKKDIIIYDMNGRYLLSNKNKDLIAQKEISQDIVREISKGKTRYDILHYDKEIGANVTSSYFRLLNNMLEPVAIVYFPFYHNDRAYEDNLQQYIRIILVASIVLIIIGVWMSWYVSKYLTKNIRGISEQMLNINLNEDFTPIAYHNDDEFLPLVNSYNKTLRMIEEQKQLLSYKEKESAWREMAKQIAHEVKNPLTPMKLLVQNFERKFDKNSPDVEQKVKKLCHSLVEQIDLIVMVANAFSEFTKLPEKKDEALNVNEEIYSLVRLFDENNEIQINAPKDGVFINFDKSFFQRIMSNVILNAQQARNEDNPQYISINVEELNKKVKIEIQDNGVGISRERLERVFEPNFTTKSSGTGLGLTMVKRMIEDYKGEINIFSEEGKGTNVVIIIPKNMNG